MSPPSVRLSLLFHFCKMQLPMLSLPHPRFRAHLDRTFELYRSKPKAGPELTWEHYLETLYVLDWFLCCSCLERDNRAWEVLFATRTGRSDCLLIDALRARAVRLYPRDEERQDSAVSEFWSHLIVSESAGSVPVLARYDGQRPLCPWLIRVFQNWHVSSIRSDKGVQALPEDDLAPPLPEQTDSEQRWHDSFCEAGREWLGALPEHELLLLGLRWRYRLSQREVAKLFGVHEGTITRQIDKLRDHCVGEIGKKLISEGWTGEDLASFIQTEMGALLLDEPRLSAESLTALTKKKGIFDKLPKT